MTSARTKELALVGAGSEPVDLWRTIVSHGLTELPPMSIDEQARTLEVTLAVGAGARTAMIRAGSPGHAAVETGTAPTAELLSIVRHMLRLDEDLSGFYELAASDPELDWVTAGAGRLLRSPTAFEDVVKTICTTNCAWSATQRMVGALVGHLGEVEPETGRRAFPSPPAMADADDDFYRNQVRAGYRGPYLRSIARSVADGSVDLEALARPELDDEEVETLLLALPGVGPYAAAHVMMLLGRYSRLVLDSWTRPKYARLRGSRPVKDSTIVRRFRRYGPFAGLAFWLYLTRDWVEDGTPPPEVA
jgi:3-methyladenine DNA glycosylase/8-oxoguanine DNA glycosylase